MSWLLIQLPFGETQHLETAVHQTQFTTAIILKRCFAAVVEVAIGFDHQSYLSP
jgi:hypothetical protein